MSEEPASKRSRPLTLGWAVALAALTGLLYFLSFPGVDGWPLAFVALAPLYLALRGQTPKRGFLLGWVAGFVMTMTGFYWLLEMLRVFSGFPTPLCVLFMALLCAYQAGRIACWGWLTARAESKGWPTGIAFALAFVTSELLFPLLFPWYFGATLHPAVALIQVAELGGPYAVGLILIATNLAAAELVLWRLERRPLRGRLLVGLLAVPLMALLYGLVRISALDAAVARAPKVRVGLVQANMSLQGKRQNKSEGLRRHLALTNELKGRGVDWVVWSETSVMRAMGESEVAARVPRTLGKELGIDTIIGAVLFRRVNDAREYALFNSALSVDAQGQVTGRYDKRFLLAFGEYLPLGETFPILYEWSPNSGQFSPGKTLDSLPIQGHPVATIICYEDLSPDFVNRMFRHQNAHMLVNMTNDAWFGDSIEPYTHFALAKFRAIEQRRYFVRSTNSGVSGFVDPVGRSLGTTPTFQQASRDATLAWLDSTTVYRVIGDAPWWLASLGCLWMAFRTRKPRGRNAPLAAG